MTHSDPNDITQQPLARALLRHLATTRDKDDPIGSLARAVVNGEADLKTSAAHSCHRDALGPAFTHALEAQRALSPHERDAIGRSVQRLHDATDDELTVDPSVDRTGAADHR